MKQSDSNSRFDSLAQEWDVAPMHIERTRDVARKVRERIPLAGLAALEVGAGTGLLSFALADDLRSVVAIDPAAGMVEVLSDKIRRSGIRNLEARLGGDDLPGIDGTFDVVLLQMALHHIPDVPGFLSRAAAVVAPSGWIAIADLDLEDGTFHGPEVTGIHLGFDRTGLLSELERAGFEPVSIETVHEVRRLVGGAEKMFPVFLAVGRKA